MKKPFLILNKKQCLLFAVTFSCCTIIRAQHPAAVRAPLDKCIRNAIKNPLGSLAEEELANLDSTELQLLKNFIYSRRFPAQRNQLLRDYFMLSDKTLTAKMKQESSFINSTAYNLELLQAFYNAAAVTLYNKEKIDSTLNGFWQESTSVIAGTLLTNYHFLLNDHSFLFEYKTANKKNRLANYSGFYSFTSTGVELEIRTKTVLKKGGLPGTTNQYVIHLEDAYEYITIRLGPVYTILFDGIEKSFCRINGKIFWKCYPPE